ncbi:Response regulator [Rubrivivax sp. A210]|uniref:response regulator n=1 Tax=Rubrivivax sp. A210 TaxID=2772301 RepID=UPI00191A3DF9|nr:response regulator [Rubrivivax sp. A210]CAD5367240.1 Response regulator [Rubrivivax sp. A210]
MIDRDIHLARALLVEGNAMLRSVAAVQLRDTGVGQVTTVSRVKEARLAIEREHFDIVICNREFEGSDDNGQDLLDELRREGQLPHSTVFLMVSSQATYLQVVEAAEGGLDGILVRPYTGALLAERLMEARRRKRELADVLQALDSGQTEVALARALKRFQEKKDYAVYCGRLVAELLMRLNRPEDSHKVFAKLAEPKQAIWARLGMARAEIAAGDLAQARKSIASVLADDPGSADAHDLAGRILVEQCNFDGALDEYRQAANITPGCLLRAQHAGALAFYQGQGAEALKFLERTVSMGLQSRLFDALSLLLLALLRLDSGDAQGVIAAREHLKRLRLRAPEVQRLARFGLAIDVLTGLAGASPEAALAPFEALAAQVGDDDFDLEAANMLLATAARMRAGLRAAEAQAAMVERIALRFCVSKAMTEVLLASARRAEPAQSQIRTAQAQVLALSAQAMDDSLKGDQAGAARRLLEAGERTLNAKLLEMAGVLARRNAAAIPEAQALMARSAELLKKSCQATNHIAGIQRAGHSLGGLKLRGRTDDRPDAVVV